METNQSETMLRGHHLKELYLFKHEGSRQYEKRTEYQGKKFMKKSSEFLKRLIENQSSKIKVVIGPDNICEICPPSSDRLRRICENPAPQSYYKRTGFKTMEEHGDSFSIKELDLTINGVYTISEILNAIESYLSKNHCFPI